MDKKLLRQNALKMRDSLPASYREQASSVICQKLLESDSYQNSQSILCYVDFRSEVQTKAFIEQALSDGKQIYCPLVEGPDMNFYQITSLSDLISGYQGIQEPKASSSTIYTYIPELDATTLMILPGAAFDTDGHRIGYGKAFYDRYLQANPITKRIGICYKEQLYPQIPTDPTDERLTAIITNNET